ncbi:DUF3313 domain-containing protein [Salinimonas sp. HHU 13199]|uniref:DUF3313 domain-containing protein n=1 Tax=Salinimonas profundi TaxID=2729140 RepID=A0ABR8LL22_9ALTE|nr:DUF3313 family protein [Salinimonas profundi]MBD3584764.1 DUF3313 domain-containing protein [Salinimonas profundi]
MYTFTLRQTPIPWYFLLVWGLMSLSACSGIPADQPVRGELTHDGLMTQKSDRNSQLQIKQDLNWQRYDKIIVEPSHVAFRKNWERDYNSDHRAGRIRPADMEAIRERMGNIVDQAVTERLADVPGMTITSQPDNNTLLIKPNVINLDVSAPDINTTGINRTYVRSSGSLTMYLEIYDATSGEILARWIEDLEDREDMYLEWSTRASNTADAKRVVNRWADEFLTGFNALRMQP